VFVDETGAKTKMGRFYGRAEHGARLSAALPHGHWKTTTFVGGPRLTGMTAPMVLDGPMDGSWFLAYIEQILVPTPSVGDTVIMDNLSSHKMPAVIETINAAGTKIRFFPAYWPDFNAIETAFSKFKASLRKSTARTIPDLWQAIAKAIDEFTPKNCAGYFAAAGYEPG
jgi:transposase